MADDVKAERERLVRHRRFVKKRQVMALLDACPLCGAFVADRAKHADWHRPSLTEEPQ